MKIFKVPTKIHKQKNLTFVKTGKKHNLRMCLISVLGIVKYKGFQEK